MKVLFTGSSGFLGRHVVVHLREAGHEVDEFDAANETGDDFTIAANLDGLSVEYDVCCHLGADGDVYHCDFDPPNAVDVNATGTANIAEWAKATDTRIVYASTWEVGDAGPGGSVYANTKALAEDLLEGHYQREMVKTISLRLGSAYGPGARPAGVMRVFIDRARAGKPITITGDGSQWRQWCHASDIARAFVLAVGSDYNGPPLNVLGDQRTSIKEIAELVVEKWPVEIAYGQPRPADVEPVPLSIEATTQALGWRPLVRFEEGFQRLLDDADKEGTA
jgi:nucleoside-diphosphate-sugar epimerase